MVNFNLKEEIDIDFYFSFIKMINNNYEEITPEIFNILLKTITNKNGKQIDKNQFYFIGNNNLKKIVTYLTDFFVYIHYNKNNKSAIIFVENKQKNIEKMELKTNYCILSKIPVKIMN